MSKKNALGRGLDALLPAADYQDSVRQIALSDIDINKDQPRKAFDQAALEQLADSIREVGVLQPLLVQQQRGRYLIIAGERRFRAAMLAGLSTVPCIEKDLTALQKRLAALIENLQREDLNPIEEAGAIRALMAEGGLTQQEAAQRLGRSRPAVANLLRLLTLPQDIQQLVSEGRLSEGHARVLAGVRDQPLLRRLARAAVDRELSVRQLERMAQEMGRAAAPRPARILAPELRDFAQRLQQATGLRTRVEGDLNRGRVVLSYASAEELDGLYEALSGILP